LKRLLILLFLALAWFAAGSAPLAAQARPGAAAASQIPAEARSVLARIKATGQPVPGYVGGRRFGNYGGHGEQQLPGVDAGGRRIAYQEWDIHPRIEGRNRGPERLVTGSDGRAWFTPDHYRTFTEVR